MPAEEWNPMHCAKSLMSLFLSGASAAATAAPALPAADAIIVTARGRSEDQLQVPISVTSLSTALTSEKLDTLEALLGAVPGVYFISDTDPGTNLISIRGVSTNRGQSPSVTIVADGRVVPDQELYTFKPFDLASAEILKGPQGALYGRAAAAGVIALHSVQPDSRTDGYARLGYGNGAAKTFDAAATTQLNDALALRLATSLADDRGYIFNQTLRKNADAFQSLNFRGTALARLSDTLSLTAQLNYATEKGGAAYVSSNNVTGRFGGLLAGPALTDPIGDYEGRSDRHWLGAMATLTLKLPTGATLTGLSAYDSYTKHFAEELDFRPDKNLTFFGFPAFPNGIQPIFQPVTLSAFTQELRYTSSDTARVRTIFGGFLQTLDKTRTDDFVGFGSFAAEQNKTTAIGLFAQANIALTSTLEAGFALRYDREQHRQFTRDRAGLLIDSQSGSFEAVQPKLTLNFALTPETSLYASASTGFKPGGFNPKSQLAPATPARFASEKTYGGELGLKTRWPGGHGEIAGFITRHDNFQNTVFLDNNLVFSIPRVNIIGFDASGDITLGNGFALTAGLSVTRARLAAYAVANPTVETPEPVAKCRFAAGTLCQFGGNIIPNSPDYTLQLGGQWQGLVGAANVMARIDYARVGKVYYEVDNVLLSPAHASIDARLAVALGSLDLTLWGKNITHQRWALAAFGQQSLQLLQALGPGRPFDSFTLNKGRSFGATIGLRFGKARP